MASGDRLVVLGATGATGRRVLRLAADAGLRPIAVGRRADALATVTAGLDAEVRVASLDPAELATAVHDAAVVIGAVGPATHFGPDMLAATLRAGAHWIDFSGEPRWVARVASEFAPRAEEAKISLLPSLGLGVAADLAAARAARSVGEVRRVTVAYRIVGMRPSVATARSTVEILAGGAPVASAAGVRFAPAGRAQAALPGLRFPTPDPLVLRTIWPDAEIETVMTVPAAPVAGFALAGLGAGLRRPPVLSLIRRGLTAWADRPQQHTHGGGGRASATVLVEGTAGCATARADVEDVYDVTARSGFLAARALLNDAGEPGLRSWSAVVGSDTTVAAEAGVRLYDHLPTTSPRRSKESLCRAR